MNNEVTLELTVTNSFISESEQYTDLPFEFEGIIISDVGDNKKIRVAVKHDKGVEREDDAAYYLFSNLVDGDYIKIKGWIDTSYKFPVVIISRLKEHILCHYH